MSFFHPDDPGIRNHMFKMLFYVNISGVRVGGCVYVELTAVRITIEPIHHMLILTLWYNFNVVLHNRCIRCIRRVVAGLLHKALFV